MFNILSGKSSTERKKKERKGSTRENPTLLIARILTTISIHCMEFHLKKKSPIYLENYRNLQTVGISRQ